MCLPIMNLLFFRFFKFAFCFIYLFILQDQSGYLVSFGSSFERKSTAAAARLGMVEIMTGLLGAPSVEVLESDFTQPESHQLY